MTQLQPILFVILTAAATVYAGCLKCDLASARITSSFPGDPSYESLSTPYNLRYHYSPAAITFPASTEQVSTVIKIGNSENLKVVARSGGHSYIANSLGGKDGVLIVDLRNLTKITVDPTSDTAVIETGNRLGSVATSLNDAGRATPHGTCPDVGIGGHAAYGGSGYTNRMWGLTLDAVQSITLVLANGTITTASQSQNSDLFWAMRGAGGSFGIATSLTVKTYPVPPSVTYFVYKWDLSIPQATTGLSTFQSFVQTSIPSYLGMNFVILTGAMQGIVRVMVIGGWYADPVGLNDTIAPLLSGFPPASNVTIDTGSYIHSLLVMGELTGSPSLTNTSFGATPFYVKSLMTPENSPMSPEAIKSFVNFFGYEAFLFPMESICILELYGGPDSALNAVERDATAFAHRSSMFTIECTAVDSKKILDSRGTGYDFVNRMVNTIISNSPSDWDYGSYPNYLDDGLKDWELRYYGGHYPRLQAIKAKYDPNDVLSFPLGISAHR